MKNTITKEEGTIALFGIISMAQATIDYTELMRMQCTWNKQNAKRSVNELIKEFERIADIPYRGKSTPQMADDQLYGARLLHWLFKIVTQLESLENGRQDCIDDIVQILMDRGIVVDEI